MEPGDLRESPAGSGGSDVGDWREETPGGDEGEDSGVSSSKTSGTKAEATLIDGSDESGHGRAAVEHLHSPYEEELDPRIQVRPAASGLPVQPSDLWITSLS